MINFQIIIKDDGYPDKHIHAECYAQNYESGNKHEKAISDGLAKEMYALTGKIMDDLGYGFDDVTTPHEVITGDRTSTIFQQTKNTLPAIECLYVFVSVDAKDGNEGVVGAPMGSVGCMPMIAADEKRLEQLIPIAQAIATSTNMKIRLIKLSRREVIKDIDPCP